MMDDILVHGPSETDHWQNLRRALEAIERSSMTLWKDKCEFGKKEIKLLGHVISREGIKPDPVKIKAIRDMSPPTTKKEARRFIGMVNYLAKFSRETAGLLASINAVTGSASEWVWENAQQNAFEEVKVLLLKAPILVPFDVTKSHRVSADASTELLHF